MLSINTNLQSLIAQNGLKTSTLKLNTAIERMTTGYKINGAKDNAANYSISTNMGTKLSAYNIAEDNVATGLDYITTASDNLDIINDKLARLRALAEQAANGTYGKQSINAMNKEAAALINEIYRTRNSVKFNGQKVFGSSGIDEQTAGAKDLVVNENGFLQDIEVRDTSKMTSLASIDETQTLAKGTYSISSADELAKLAKMQNAGKITAGSEFVLGADIDLSEYSSGYGWTAIGNGNRFTGTFDGNGYKISNLYINTTYGYNGLFGSTQNATIKNLGIISGKLIHGNICNGPLVGCAFSSNISNCYATIENINNCASANPSDPTWLGGDGGLIGKIDGVVENCYATGNVSGTGKQCGGLIGQIISENFTIRNCFATGNVDTEMGMIGGLIGQGQGTIENCYATGNVTSKDGTLGGFAGYWSNGSVLNCHSTGNVNNVNKDEQVGGFIGTATNINAITDCYSTGNVNSISNFVGGFIGVIKNNSSATIKNCFATGDVNCSGFSVGGFLGTMENTTNLEITDCYSTGDVASTSYYVGGFLGQNYNCTTEFTNCYSTGNVQGTSNIGGFCGRLSGTNTITNCYSSGKVNGSSGNYIGGLCGYMNSTSSLESCYVLGESDNLKGVFAGYSQGTITNCCYSSYYEDKGIKLVYSGKDATDSTTYNDVVPYSFHENHVGLQVGINGDINSRINAETSISLGNLRNILTTGIQQDGTLELLDSIINTVSEKQTKLGASQNRLESALEEISTQYDNLASSQSTLRDADIAQVSSDYIKQQILQQASATLLSTANQSPALALQLI